MLNRQRVLLGLIYFARPGATKELSRTRLMKYAFLLTRESRCVPKSASYDFVPYKYGPFSFSLYRDLATLQRHGHIDTDDDNAPLAIPEAAKETAWREIERLPADVRTALDEVCRKYGRMEQDRLLREVYRRFPWYGLRTERHDLLPDRRPEEPRAQIAVYTFGYEGLTVDGFFNFLLHKGIQKIIDVRRNPVSRKYGFARSSMSSIAARLGLQYIHLPQLGIDPSRRKNLETRDDYEHLLNWYEQTLPDRDGEIERAVEHVKGMPCALVCVEADPAFCHRSRLAKAISERAGVPVQHLVRKEHGG